MSVWKSAYLVHGDDHGRIGERRAKLWVRAERESGAGAIEAFKGDSATPAAVAGALSAMTLVVGRRFLVVEGVERWKDADVKSHLLPALDAMDANTTVAFFGREDGRLKAPGALRDAVKGVGGVVAAETVPKPKDLPRWVIAEGEKLGVALDLVAARTLVAMVGERQQRLLRELEKLAVEHGAGARVGEEAVLAVAAPSSERQVWGLVDALVAHDHRGAVRSYLALRAQGESLPRLVPLLARRLREVLAVAVRLEAGESPTQLKSALRMSPWAADRRIKEARSTDATRLRLGLEALAALEVASRGLGDGDEDTAALRALQTLAA